MTVLTDMHRRTCLKKLEQIGQPMNLLEIGFTATPHLIRNMAAHGLVRVTVEMTDRGKEWLAKENAKRRRKLTNEAKVAKLAGGLG